jgi:hypothetical protein
MEKIAKAVVSLAAVASMATAQTPCWSGSGPGPVTTTCNVGIGTTTPAYPLEAVGAGYGPGFDVIPNGTYGNRASIGFGVNSGVTTGWIIGQDYAANGSKDLYWYDIWTSSVPLYISGNSATPGYVGIGTTSPQHLLGVAGTIGAEEVIVLSNGADYVFDPGYKLKPLSEISEYIKENHHLPEIPPANEVQERGVGLGEMQTKLLAKIEELTLHMIQAEEENRKLRERVERLEAEGGRAHEN